MLLQKTNWMCFVKGTYENEDVYVEKEPSQSEGCYMPLDLNKDKVCVESLKKLFHIPEDIIKLRFLAYDEPGKDRILFDLIGDMDWGQNVIPRDTLNLCDDHLELYPFFERRVHDLMCRGIEKIFVECEYEY